MKSSRLIAIPDMLIVSNLEKSYRSGSRTLTVNPTQAPGVYTGAVNVQVEYN